MTELNVARLSPNIRKTVMWLRSHGFETTDSGDGTNHAAGMECAFKYANVFMQVDPSLMLQEAHRLLKLVNSHGNPSKYFSIEVSYSPIDEIAMLMLFGFSDSQLESII